MKLTRYARDKNSAAVKGLLSVDEIIKEDWRRNYKKSGVSATALATIIKDSIDNGAQPMRLRNTIVLITPDEDDPTTMQFHTVTADPYEIYTTLITRLFVALAKTQGAETLYTGVPDKSALRMAKRTFGDKFVDLEEDGPADNKYTLTIDIGDFYRTHNRQQVQ